MAKKRAVKSKPKETSKGKRGQASRVPTGKERRRATKIATTIARCASGDSDSSKQTQWLLCKEALVSPPSTSKSVGEVYLHVGFTSASSSPKSPTPPSCHKKVIAQDYHKPTFDQRKSISAESWKTQEQGSENKKESLDDSDFSLGKEEDELFHFLLASTFYQPSSSIPSPCVSILTPPRQKNDAFWKGVRMTKILPVSPIQVSHSSKLAVAPFKDSITKSIEPDLIDEEKVTCTVACGDSNRIPLLVSFQRSPKKNIFGRTSLGASFQSQTAMLFSPIRSTPYATAAGTSLFLS